MATNAENLATIKANLLTYLATESASPKPSYSIDGESISWDSHRSSIMQQIASIDELLAAAEGPWEIETVGKT